MKKIEAFIGAILLKVETCYLRNKDSAAHMLSLNDLRARLFSVLSFLISIFIGPIMVYGAYLFYINGERIPALLELLFCVTILLVLNTNLLKETYKKIFTVSILYIIGYLLLIYTGPSGAGVIGIFFAFILSLSFLNRSLNLILFLTNIGITVVITWLLLSGHLDGFNIAGYKNTWLMIALCLQTTIIAIFYVWDSIFSRLDRELQELELSEEKYRLIAETMADVIWVLNTSTMRFTYISPSIERIRGYSVEEALNQNVLDTMPAEHAARILDLLQESLTRISKEPGYRPVIYEQIQQFCKNGDLIWVEFSAKLRYNRQNEVEVVGVSRDITERLIKEEKIQYLSSHDPLTSLKNTNALRTFILEQDVKTDENGKYSIITIDIDSFRIVNDSMGQTAGDQMIVRLADVIRCSIGDKGIVYRIAGDEFVILLPDCSLDEIYEICVELQKSISSQVKIRDRTFYLTASIGCCTGDEDKPLANVLHDAGIALYAAKKKKNTIVIYDPSMDNQRTRDALLEADLHGALDKGEFELHFQPVIDVKSGAIDHAEALLRWKHPEYGMISPLEFIPIAEKTKLIIPITCWVIEECCRKLNEWEAIGIREISVSINLSLVWFESRSSEITEYISSTARKTGISPDRINLEITESSLMYDPDEIIRMFHSLKKQGLRLALDDFGTGYSSFGYMKDLPLDIIKLDRSLTNVLAEDERDRMIVRTMITIAHGLNLQVVAEGVETQEQYEYLKSYDCDLIQGYLFSKPLNNDAFKEYYLGMQ